VEVLTPHSLSTQLRSRDGAMADFMSSLNAMLFGPTSGNGSAEATAPASNNPTEPYPDGGAPRHDSEIASPAMTSTVIHDVPMFASTPLASAAAPPVEVLNLDPPAFTPWADSRTSHAFQMPVPDTAWAMPVAPAPPIDAIFPSPFEAPLDTRPGTAPGGFMAGLRGMLFNTRDASVPTSVGFPPDAAAASEVPPPAAAPPEETVVQPFADSSQAPLVMPVLYDVGSSGFCGSDPKNDDSPARAPSVLVGQACSGSAPPMLSGSPSSGAVEGFPPPLVESAPSSASPFPGSAPSLGSAFPVVEGVPMPENTSAMVGGGPIAATATPQRSGSAPRTIDGASPSGPEMASGSGDVIRNFGSAPASGKSRTNGYTNGSAPSSGKPDRPLASQHSSEAARRSDTGSRNESIPVFSPVPSLSGITSGAFGSTPGSGTTKPRFGYVPHSGQIESMFGSAPGSGTTRPLFGGLPNSGQIGSMFGSAPGSGATQRGFGCVPNSEQIGSLHGSAPGSGTAVPRCASTNASEHSSEQIKPMAGKAPDSGTFSPMFGMAFSPGQNGSMLGNAPGSVSVPPLLQSESGDAAAPFSWMSSGESAMFSPDPQRRHMAKQDAQGDDGQSDADLSAVSVGVEEDKLIEEEEDNEDLNPFGEDDTSVSEATCMPSKQTSMPTEDPAASAAPTESSTKKIIHPNLQSPSLSNWATRTKRHTSESSNDRKYSLSTVVACLRADNSSSGASTNKFLDNLRKIREAKQATRVIHTHFPDVMSRKRIMQNLRVLPLVALVAGPFYAVVEPFMLAFNQDVNFVFVHILCYIIDAGVCTISLRQIMKDRCLRRANFPYMANLLFCGPFDMLLWFTEMRMYIPWIRMMRLCYAGPAVSKQLRNLEVDSAGLSYSKARALRLTLLVVLVSHLLACAFYEFSRLAGAVHYKTAPWSPDTLQLSDEAIGSLYLRALYWASCTMTTVGHVDKASTRSTDLEVSQALVVAIFVTIVYLFVVGNANALLLKSHQQVDQYRTKLATVDTFLHKRHVRPALCRLVRQHVKDSRTDDKVDDSFLDELPRALRNEVLRDINMKVLVSAPIFHSCNPTMIALLCSVLRRCVFLKGDVLSEQGTISNEMFFLESGRVVTEKKRNESRSLARTSTDVWSRAAAPCDRRESAEKARNRTGSTNSEKEKRARTGSNTSEQERQEKEKARGRTNSDGSEKARGRSGSNDASPACRRKSIASSIKSFASTTKGRVVGPGSENSGRSSVTSCCDKKGSEAERNTHANEVHLSKSGVVIAAESVLFGLEQPVTVTAAVRSICLSVRREDFNTVLTDFAADTSVLRRNYIDLIREEDEERAQQLEKVIKQWRSSAITELLYAAAQGEVGKVRALLENKDEEVKATDTDYDGRTALHLAAGGGHVNVMRMLIKHKADVNALDRHGNTPLYDAYTQRKPAAGKLLRSLAGKLFYSRTRMANELCSASRDGDVDTVRQLLDYGCDPNALNDDGRTSLHVAAAVGNLTVTGLLLERGASPNARDNAGFTAMYEAVRNNHAGVAFALHKYAGQLGLSGEEAASQLNNAVRAEDMNMLRWLITNGAEPSAPDYDGRTCMHVAASMGNLAMVEFLLQRGVDPNHRDRWGGTPLADAVREGHMHIVKHLLSYGDDDFVLQEVADPNVQDMEGRTVLHAAASRGNRELIELLLSHGAKLDLTDRWGVSPVECAAQSGFKDMLDQVLEKVKQKEEQEDAQDEDSD